MAGELAHGASQAHYIGFIAAELLRNVSPTYLQDPESFFNTFCGSVLVPHGKEIPSMVNKPFLNYQGVGGRLFNLCKQLRLRRRGRGLALSEQTFHLCISDHNKLDRAGSFAFQRVLPV